MLIVILQILIPVSTQLDKWTVAEVLKDKFIHNQSQRDTINITAQLENKAEATIELSASFLAYVAESIPEDQSTYARTALLLICLNIRLPSTKKCPLILTLGQIRVRLFYATSRKTNAKHHFVDFNPSVYPI